MKIETEGHIAVWTPIFIAVLLIITKMSTNWGTENQNFMHPYNEGLFGHKSRWSIYVCSNMNEPWKYAKWKKPF
jgi:hypothetical protein